MRRRVIRASLAATTIHGWACGHRDMTTPSAARHRRTDFHSYSEFRRVGRNHADHAILCVATSRDRRSRSVFRAHLTNIDECVNDTTSWYVLITHHTTCVKCKRVWCTGCLSEIYTTCFDPRLLHVDSIFSEHGIMLSTSLVEQRF